MLELVKQLSDIERKVLLNISEEYSSLEDISSKTELNIDSVRRAFAWLNDKELAVVTEKEIEKLFLTIEGKKCASNGMPEKVFLSTLASLNGKASFKELQEKSGLDSKEFTAALGINKKNAFIVISQGEISLTGLAEEYKTTDLEKILNDILNNKKVDSNYLSDLFNRNLIEKKLFVSRSIKISELGKEAKLILEKSSVDRVYDVKGEVPRIFMGKKAPYIQFLQQIRSKLVSLGFNEMYSPLIVPEFYNFDTLFQPQNHPARTWTDTYQLKQPKFGKLPQKNKVDAIKAAHESGGKAKSTGWGYKWDENIAKKLMPAAHGTAHSARQLVEGVELPHKYFAIARCFRPDVLDATHLLEFNQMEGFVVGENLNFKHLLGMLKEFAIEIAGAEKVKFFPDYYPFTEPSVQLSAKHPEMGWIEFAGAGMFRPEMLENLDIKGEAIAWGVGIDRLAMFKLGVKDIRYLFAEDLSYLRKAKGVLI